jgi:hypothetical protein
LLQLQGKSLCGTEWSFSWLHTCYIAILHSVLDELKHHVLKTLLLVANWKPFLHCFSAPEHLIMEQRELGIYLALSSALV